MATYVVTGGVDGTAGIEIKGRRYEPGDTVEITDKKDGWLLKQGYVASAANAPKPAAKPATKPTGGSR